MGLGVLGRSVGDIAYMAQHGAELIVTDLKPKEKLQESLDKLSNYTTITYRLGEHQLEDFRDRDMILKGPSVPLNSIYIEAAKREGTPIEMSASLMLKLSGIYSIGVTGTRGKSTVTYLLHDLLERSGRHVILGGNIKSVSNLQLLDDVQQDSIALLELDSWQLQGFGESGMSPNIAVFTTFFPDHMNYYASDPTNETSFQEGMKLYLEDKAQIFLHQKESDTFVLGNQVADQIQQYESQIQSNIVIGDETSIPDEWNLIMPGMHNRYNAGCAAEAARVLGVDEEVIQESIEQFAGVPGRLVCVQDRGGVRVFNDNNSTTPDATIAALRALDDGTRNVILIAGGDTKHLDMHRLIEEIGKRVKAVVLMDEIGTREIADDVLALPDIEASVEPNLAACVKKARDLSESGNVILFSPAFASFGKFFKNEYEREALFMKLIEA